MTQVETERCGGRVLGGYCEACGARPEATVCKHPKKSLDEAVRVVVEYLSEHLEPRGSEIHWNGDNHSLLIMRNTLAAALPEVTP